MCISSILDRLIAQSLKGYESIKRHYSFLDVDIPYREMAPILYATDFSPPARAVLIVAKILGLKLEIKPINIAIGEQFTPEYTKINPTHSIPTLVDGDTIIWDSHAINSYLVGKYGKDDTLYPRDLAKRALIDQRLHFDTGSLFYYLRAIVRGRFMKKFEKIPKNLIDDTWAAYGNLEIFLEGREWIAGDSLTLADISLYTTVASMNHLVPIVGEKYPKLVDWIQRIHNLPEFEVDKSGLVAFEKLAKMLLP